MRAHAVLLVSLTLLAAAADAQPLGCPNGFEHETVAEINLRRALVSLPAVSMDVRLMEAAQLHSDDMATNDFFSHTGTGGTSQVERVEVAGYVSWLALGETIAAGYPTPADVVQGWIDSPPHQAILLGSPYLHVGVGHSFSGGSTWGHYWTANFGDTATPQEPPVDSCPACSNGEDDDGDGLVDDADDPGCLDFTSTRENPKCDDDLDNDGDGAIDWDGGAGGGAVDPQCSAKPWKNKEAAGGCGLGFEIVPLALAVAAARRPLRRR